MAKYTVKDSDRTTRATVTRKTLPDNAKGPQSFNWWRAKSKGELTQQVIETAAYLKENQQYRDRQANINARMYGNIPLMSNAGSNLGKLNAPNTLPADRPTMNVVQSCIDTLVSRIAQAKPRPVFLTDGGYYKQRRLAKQLNSFIAGELYQTKAYEKVEMQLRDAAILGTGALHVYRTDDDKVGVERVLNTELYVDGNDAFYGKPRSLYRLKLVDRAVAAAQLPEERSKVAAADAAYPDNSGDSSKTMSDQIMLVEAWHLPSSSESGDGRHVIACTSGVLLDEEYCDEDYPFVFLDYSPRLVGMWAQGLAEQLMGTQIEINKLLVTISQSISLVGVPRVFVEDGSKVVKAHLNNQVGSIVTYRGTKPEYSVAPSVHPELYAQLQRLIDYAYQQSGISALAASSQKPAGLNSGEAIRNYDDLQSDRFATLNKRYNQVFVELSHKILDCAAKIAEETGKYQTIYPDKDGVKEIDIPAAAELEKNPFVIQCLDSSALPKEPAGRLQTVVDMMQSGIIDPQEGRRLLDFPDLGQANKLAIAAEERIYKQLDDIIESGAYEPPDPFTDINLGKKIVAQYYNLYTAANLEESKAEMLRTWQSQLLVLEQAAQPPMQPPGAPMGTGTPGAPPVAELAQTAPQGAQ